MKSLKMLVMAALTILTVSAFAQSNTTNFKKEQMKMKVMKSYTSPKSYDATSNITHNYSNNGFASNAASKEKMKMGGMNLNSATKYQDVAIDKSAVCTKCLTISNLLPKEQMKTKVMGLYKCVMSADNAGNMTAKCSSVCPMNVMAANSR